MAETTQSLSMGIREDLMTGGGNVPKTSPSKTEHVLGLENIQIQILKMSALQATVKEVLEKRNNTQVVQWIIFPIQKTKKWLRSDVELNSSRRSDTVQAEQVLSKKFGEQLPHEKPSIFNKKL